MTDTTAAHEILRDAWADVQRFDRYALGVLGALIAAPHPAPTREALAEVAGVPKAIVDYAIEQLAAHGYVDRLQAVAPHLTEVLGGVSAPAVGSEPESPPVPAARAVVEPVQSQKVPLSVRRAFSVATDEVLNALDALEDAPLALEGPSRDELHQVARTRLRRHAKLSGTDLDSLADVVAGYVWNYADEAPGARRQHVLETIPRAPMDLGAVVEPHFARLVYGRRNSEGVLIACRSLYAEANLQAMQQRLETAAAPEPLNPEQLEAAAVAAAQRVATQRQKNERNPYRATGQKSRKSPGRRGTASSRLGKPSA